jgi:hypothetical protein
LRAQKLASLAPNCECERQRVSEYSPGVVGDETLVRLIYTPMFVHRTQKRILPNAFSHATTQGLSVQRLECATDAELSKLVNYALAQRQDAAWLGYVQAPSAQIRDLRDDQGQRTFCIYDTSERENPAHSEICVAYEIPETDGPVVRAELMKAFRPHEFLDRNALKNGVVWSGVDPLLKERHLPPQWQPS